MYMDSFRWPPRLGSVGISSVVILRDTSMQGCTILVPEAYPLDSTSLHVSHANADDKFDADERFARKRDHCQNVSELEGEGVWLK